MNDSGQTILKDYMIKHSTMAVLPAIHGQETYSKVLEEKGEYFIALPSKTIVTRSCKYYGSSYEGRREGTKELTGVTHKAPIVIEPINKMYFFPTASPSQPHCAWLSYEHITNHFSSGKANTTIVFSNGKSIELEVSKASFESQLRITAQLQTLILRRIETNGRKINFIVARTKIKDFR